MKYTKSILIVITLIVLTAIACKKPKPEEENKENKVTITINTPSAEQQFAHGSTVSVTGTIVADEELHGYSIIIRQKSDNSTLFEASEHTHGTTVTFEKSWENTLTNIQELELEIIAVIDHNGNTANKTLTFYSQDN